MHCYSLNIEFTVEKQSDEGSLSFLDILVKKQTDGQLTTSVYRKPTHTNQYLNWNSHHPLHQKVGTIRTLAHRASVISGDAQSKKSERTLLSEAFRDCDYPDWALKKGFRPPKPKEDDTQREDKEYAGFATIPYVKGITEPISRILNKAGLKVAMKPCTTLRQQLVSPKDKDSTLDRTGIVYEIDCNRCEDIYIGQTGRHLRDRLKEHKQSVDKGHLTTSAVAEHAYAKHHEINWDNVKILDQDSNKTRRLVKESLHIRTKKPAMNRAYVQLAKSTQGQVTTKTPDRDVASAYS
jgi:hypothetical protein